MRTTRIFPNRKLHEHFVIVLVLLLMTSACATHVAPVAPPPPPPVVYIPPPPPKPSAHIVRASWYGSQFAGRPTTSGERFNPNRLTAASKTLPLGSIVKVENPKNGRAVTVRINDCGPFVRGRSLDLSRRAARKIGITHQGVVPVKLVTLKAPTDGAKCDD
jgi:rare lipoprotein A